MGLMSSVCYIACKAVLFSYIHNTILVCIYDDGSKVQIAC